MVSFVSSCTSSCSETGGMSPLSSRARSSVTSPAPHSRAAVPASGSSRARVSTATAISGRSSDRVSDWSVRSRCRAPNPSVPRSRMLAATSCLPYRSSSASAANRPAARCRSPK